MHSFKNTLSELPEGALVQANNVVIDRDSVIEPRRGFKQYGDTFGIGSDRTKQLLTYKGRILRHFESTLQFDSDGAGIFSSFSGTYSEVDAGLRIKAIESNGNLYFTTDAGIKKISATTASDLTTATGFIEDAGGVKALDVSGTVNYSTAGFFSAESKTAYRIVWGKKDANTNLILGFPSAREVITNFSATNTGTIDLSFSIPDSITSSDTEYFYQVYRTAVFPKVTSLEDVDPGDEMFLVIEDFPTTAELTTTRTVSVNDITPEDFRSGGALLYTNPVSGDGIAQANEVPPLARDMALFKGSTFYANTETKHRLELNLLSVANLISGTSTITLDDGTTSNVYTFRGAKEVTDVTFDTFANTTDGGYFLLNSSSNKIKYFVWMDKTGSTAEPSAADTIGRLPIRCDLSALPDVTANDVATTVAAAVDLIADFSVPVPGGSVITVTNANNGNTDDAIDGTTGVGGIFAINITTQGDGEDSALNEILLSAAATPSQQIDETARSIVNIINRNTSETVSAFYLSGPTDIPGLILLESKSLGTSSFFAIANSDATGSQFNPALPTSGTSVSSDNEISSNRLFFSKFQQPESVPIVNFIDVGPKDKAIIRILPLRESLFILKEDGIYRLTGEVAPNFIVDLFDTSSQIAAADSAAVLNNQIYMLSREDITTISDTGVSIISRDIEDQITKIASTHVNFATASFGFAYESDRAYLLWTTDNISDTQATQCFRYNVFTNSWSRFDITKTCGIVNPETDKVYLGASDSNFIEIERKDFSRTDFADREFSLSLAANAVTDLSLDLSSSSNASIGDIILQNQTVTLSQMNQLLRRLELDPFVGDSDYISTLGVSPGDSLRTTLDNLAIKLDADSGVTDTDYAASLGGGASFSAIQTDFNIIIAKLNLDTGVKFTDYRTSVGILEFEVPITAVISNSNTVSVQYNAPFLEGPIILFKGIKAEITWAPQHFGDPSISKHIREGTVIFENNVFNNASISYSSDLSPDFQAVDFAGAGIGDWGWFSWDSQNWGGGGSAVPLRTYIPRDKQRCRYINPKFTHGGAREKFSIFGISFTLRPISERAYNG